MSGNDIARGRATCGSIDESERREWLVTNGIGGYASGTIGGIATRRYHGVLVAALAPPVGRRLLVTAIDEIVNVDSATYELGAHRCASGAIAPQGYRYLERFELDGTVPAWTYACAQASLVKRIWMEHCANRTYVRYELRRGNRVALELKVLVNDRDFHANTHGIDRLPRVDAVPNGIEIETNGAPLVIRVDAGDVAPEGTWYRDVLLTRETERGLDDRDDTLLAATVRVVLDAGDSCTLACGDVPATFDAATALARNIARETSVLADFRKRNGSGHPPWIERLALAADQFVVRREAAEHCDARSIVAGYHWFGDWGRDTMIALPGVALATGRSGVSATILETFGRYVDNGMLPNYFPDDAGVPQYNTVDAALWYVEAVRLHYVETRDAAFVRRAFPVLSDIARAYVRGTRYGIRQTDDGLIIAGEPGVQLTWMDAKVRDWVVTPRRGKPVEVNALWYNALDTLATLAPVANVDARPYRLMAQRTLEGFQRYWNAERGYLFDVIDGPEGLDASIRPNAIFAVALTASPLQAEQRRAVVDTCARELLTSFGLRSLGSGEPNYVGTYRGNQLQRDAAYHEGTVWGWLLGPFAIAHYRAYGDPDAALAFLQPMRDQLDAYGLGSAGELAEGDAPHRLDGCIAQAWSVGEVLRAYLTIATRPPWPLRIGAKLPPITA